MTKPSRTLLTLAAIAAVPAAWGLDVTDADLKLGLTMQLQLRAEASLAEDNAGTKYSPAEGAGDPDTADFYVRRARIGFTGMYKEKFKFAAVLNADNTDKTTSADASRGVKPHLLFVGTSFPCMLSDSIKHYVQFGLDDAAYNGSQNIFSSRELLMPASRATGNLMKNRGVGVKWMVTAPNVQGWIDIQNNSGDTSETTADTRDEGEGLWYSARLHLSPDGDWKIAKATESFLGASGKGVLVAIDGAFNDTDSSATASTDVSTMGYGLEVLGHFDAVTALAEFRAQEQSGNGAHKDSVVYLLQAGYALPWKDTVLEPALRISYIDLNKNDNNETDAFSANDYGASGTQLELGVNWYLNKHNNKIQAGWTNWDGEAAGKAKADIVRVQWQLAF
ncbi:MAG TPA: hypothetical protein DCS97_15920 [Planctomycetes bacterium]|nr:hypothetical protein [Planctomycetota bacterium]